MPAPSAARVSALCLSLVLGLYFVIGIQYAALTPAWQVPDEPAHYNYVRAVAGGRLPVLQAGDYNQDYLNQLTSEGFPPDKPVDSLRYEGHQPPLYYLLAAPVFLASGGELLPLRLFSLALGGGVIAFAFLTARALFGSPALAVTAAGLAAFVPQHVAMMAGVNNDSLAELLVGAVLWACVALLQDRRPADSVSRITHYALPLLLGAAFLTKATAYVVAPVAALAVWLKARREGWPIARLARSLAWTFVPALGLGALWWGRNLAVYGWPDFLGLDRHASIIAGQPRTAEWIAAFGLAEFLRRFFVTTFQSFWGQFGWMGVVMDARVYWALLAFSLFILVGSILAAMRARRDGTSSSARRDGLAVLSFSAGLTGVLYIYYNLDLVQHQGRYLFPALIPLATWGALGLREWARGARNKGLEEWFPLGAILLMATLDLFALYRFIVPGLPRF
jgi:4-amino-4-deoxy-L-arabinose transferase-like glycosyltransferase